MQTNSFQRKLKHIQEKYLMMLIVIFLHYTGSMRILTVLYTIGTEAAFAVDVDTPLCQFKVSQF